MTSDQIIFLSYGHDQYANEAKRIKEDLEERGYTVLFDLDIKPGIDWENYIENSLKQCNMVILLMTPHSVRRPDGYCLREIAKAMSKNKFIIPIMLVWCEQPLTICHIQHLDMRDVVPINEKQGIYKTRFDRLIKAIEQRDLDFEGGQVLLKKYLRPLDFKEEIKEHIDRFIGREWLINKLNIWLEEDSESRVFWLLGGPGIGKTAISSYLCHNHNRVIAHHLCVYGHDDKSDPQRAILSLAYDIAQEIPEYEQKLQDLNLEREILKNTSTIFDNIIVQPLSNIKNPDHNFLVLIDALDEATKNGHNEIAEFIRDQWMHTPYWLKLIITSRNEPDIQTTLSELNPYILDADSEENLKDLSDFLVYELNFRNLNVDNTILKRIISKSEGLFLYIRIIIDEIDLGRLSLDNVEEFPIGLSGIYQKFFERQFSDLNFYKNDIKPMIECICTQRKPLPLDILFKAMEITEFEGRTRLGYVASFFPIKREKSKNSIIQEKFDETVNETVKPFHRSIIDWLTGKNQNTGLFKAGVYAIDLKDGNNKLANGCWYEYKNWNNNPSSQLISDYTLHYLIQHLMEIDQPSAKEKLEEIINDADFNKLRLSRGLHRIYISYAPKEISFTKRLKKDLSNVGHYITNEIDESDVFMLLMTPQSVNRPDGDCLNEIAYALQKNLVPIPIMISWCDPPLSISRIQWLDMQNCIPFEENDEVYNQVFQVLLERLKTPEIIIDKYKSLFRIS